MKGQSISLWTIYLEHFDSCIQALQKEREDKLVKILIDRLHPYVEGHIEEFVDWATSEAIRLSQAGKI